jgi:hypothetical protein
MCIASKRETSSSPRRVDPTQERFNEVRRYIQDWSMDSPLMTEVRADLDLPP